ALGAGDGRLKAGSALRHRAGGRGGGRASTCPPEARITPVTVYVARESPRHAAAMPSQPQIATTSPGATGRTPRNGTPIAIARLSAISARRRYMVLDRGQEQASDGSRYRSLTDQPVPGRRGSSLPR